MQRKFAAIIGFLFASLFVFAQEKFSKVKIYPPSSLEARNELLAVLEIDHFYPDGDGIVSEISASAMKRLKKSRVQFEVLIDDVAKDFATNNSIEDFYKGANPSGLSDISRMGFEVTCAGVNNIITTPASFTAGSMGGYYTYAEMNAKVDALVAAYPSIVTKINIGTSVQGRAIFGVKISDNPLSDEAEPEVLYTGLQHAREAIGGTSLIFFMQYLAEKYSNDTRVADLVNNREIFIIPCLNPDGYEYNRQTNPSGGGTWRKNRRLNSGGSYGVDLNRNYSVDFGNCAGASSSCGSSSQTNDTYWGTGAFSEPETKAIKDFVTSRNFVIAIDQHCYGPYYSLPFGRPSLHALSGPDQLFYNYVPALMGKYNCHRAGNSPQTVGYEVAGGQKDWMLLGDIGTGTKGKVYGMTGEAGGGGFWAPSSQIVYLSKGLCFQNLQVAYAAGSYIDVQDASDVSVTSAAGNFNGLLRRVGLANAPVTVSIIPLQNIASVGAPVTVSNLGNYYDSYTAPIAYTLPSTIVNGSRIRFVWKVETGGYTTYDTVTKFYNPVTLLSDNMEGSFSTNWTATISPNASGGWAFTTLAAYEGTRSMTESPNGNYTAASTRRVTYKNAINLADATSAYLSFWVKYRAENCNDKLRIQVSTNGGTTYTSVCGLNTIAENAGTVASVPSLTGIREIWTRELVDLSAFKGNSNVRFRFEFTSNTDASSDSYYKKVDDGFYIDNVKIIKTSTAVTAKESFVNLSGILTPAKKGRLTWEASTGETHDHFIVEKSADGIHFTEIGKVTGLPPFELTDNNTKDGDNIYRIKQVEKNGAVAFSKILNLVKGGNVNVVMYPNPVTDALNVQLTNVAASIIEVTDLTGRVIYRKAVNNNAGRISIDTKLWSNQVYILRVKGKANELITTQKFVKQ